MEYPKIYEKRLVINSRDVDGAGHCRASALLGYLQDASAEHSTLCRFDRRTLLERYHVFWMLTRVKFCLDRPIRWLEELTVRTGHRDGKGVLLYRDYELFAGDESVGCAASLWVLPDWETRKLLNTSVTPIPALAASAGGLTPQIRRLTALHAPDGLLPVEERLMRYSDTDVNGHVSNTKYADFACDTLDFQRFPADRFLSELEITYHGECVPGEVLSLSAVQAQDEAFIHGAGTDGENRFDARLRFSKQSKDSEVTYVKR